MMYVIDHDDEGEQLQMQGKNTTEILESEAESKYVWFMYNFNTMTS